MYCTTSYICCNLINIYAIRLCRQIQPRRTVSIRNIIFLIFFYIILYIGILCSVRTCVLCLYMVMVYYVYRYLYYVYPLRRVPTAVDEMAIVNNHLFCLTFIPAVLYLHNLCDNNPCRIILYMA